VTDRRIIYKHVEDEHDCDAIDFKEGKLYQFLYDGCGLYTNMERFPKNFAGVGDVVMFLEYDDAKPAYDQCFIKVLWKDKIRFFSGGLCTRTFREL